MAAVIFVNGSEGSRTDIALGSIVTLSCATSPSDVSYEWVIVSQPIGQLDNLSNTNLSTISIEPTKEGSYLIELTLNKSLPTQSIKRVVVAVKQVKSLERVPAASEALEVDSVNGWSGAVNSWLRRLDSVISDSGYLAVVAGESLNSGDIVYAESFTTVKQGYPGAERLLVVRKAISSAPLHSLFLIDPDLNSGRPLTQNSVILARFYGISYIPGSFPAGAVLYSNSTGQLTHIVDTNIVTRPVGNCLLSSSGICAVFFDGGLDQRSFSDFVSCPVPSTVTNTAARVRFFNNYLQVGFSGSYSNIITSATQVKSVLAFGNVLTSTDGRDIHYLSPWYSETTTTDTEKSLIVPVDGTLVNAYAKSDLAHTSGSITLTLRKNGVDTAIQLRLLAGATSDNNTSRSVDVQAGDKLSVKLEYDDFAGPINGLAVSFALR